MNRISKVSALVASATTLPLAESATAQTFPPPAPGTMTYTFEGGIAFANFGKSDFPGGVAGFIPQDLDKTGALPVTSGDLLGPGNRSGGYGSFSVTRNINAIDDWRFSAGFLQFGTRTHSASASQLFTGEFISPTNTASVTESDRFALYTADFDFGRTYSSGLVSYRGFAGLRSVYTNDRFDWNVNTNGTDKTGFETVTNTVTNTLNQGRSSFFGVGPRIGVDFFAGSTWGVVAGISTAVMFGSRQTSWTINQTVVVDGGAPAFGSNVISADTLPWIGNVSGNLGLAWQISPNTQFVIGYKFDQWFHVRESFTFAGLNRQEDIFVQTPFIRAVVRF